MKAKAVFLDRDGVINEERGYVHSPAEFSLLPRVVDSIGLLRSTGFKVVVVTNQAGVARGLFGLSEVDILHRHFQNSLAAEGEKVDAIYFCPHHPRGTVPEYTVHCNCRKPMPGLLLRAARELNLDLTSSYLVGDKLVDIQAGIQAGVKRTFLVKTGHPLSSEAISYASYVVSGVHEAASAIIDLERERKNSR